MKKKPVTNVMQRVAEALDLPADAVAGVPRVEIIGAREVIVTNHGGIIEYSSELIAVAGGGVVTAIRGASLDLIAMSASELSIRGTIFAVEFKY